MKVINENCSCHNRCLQNLFLGLACRRIKSAAKCDPNESRILQLHPTAAITDQEKTIQEKGERKKDTREQRRRHV